MRLSSAKTEGSPGGGKRCLLLVKTPIAAARSRAGIAGIALWVIRYSLTQAPCAAF